MVKIPRCLVSSFLDRLDFVAVLRDVTRGAPAREIKSGKGFAEAPESETGFPFLQLYVRARHPHS